MIEFSRIYLFLFFSFALAPSSIKYLNKRLSDLHDRCRAVHASSFIVCKFTQFLIHSLIHSCVEFIIPKYVTYVVGGSIAFSA